MPKALTRETRRRAASPAIGDYTNVALTHDVEALGTVYPTGTRGVVVHRHDDAIGYEVEFESPRFAVLTLTSQDLEAV